MNGNEKVSAAEGQGEDIPENEDCGLFVGVGDYSTYARSVGQHARRRDLPGSVNDAKTFWRVARWMGMRPENLRILTSPPIDPAELEGATAANVGEATEAGILKGVTWLASKLAGRPERAGLTSYSGHGAYSTSKGLLLCPSNTEGETLEHAIPFSRLSEIVGPARQNITAVIDCCFSGAAGGRDDRPVPSLGRVPVPGDALDQTLAVAGRALVACRAEESTQQVRVMGTWHGAFTWALSSAMEQWRSVPDGVGRRLDVTYGELVERTTALMRTLQFEGTPQVKGPDGVRDLSVLQRGESPLDTSQDTNAPAFHAQMDPGQKDYRWYTIKATLNSVANSVLANVLVPATTVTISGTTYYAGTEYWFNVSTYSPSGTMTISWADYDSTQTAPSLGTRAFNMPQGGTWANTARSALWGSSSAFYSSSTNLLFFWQITSGSGVWGGSQTWYYGEPLSSVFGSGWTSPATLSQASAGVEYMCYWRSRTVTPL